MSDPEVLVGTSVFAKDPVSAGVQIYYVYASERDRPKKTVDLLFERGQKAMRVTQKASGETVVSYMDRMPAKFKPRPPNAPKPTRRGGKRAKAKKK